MTSAVSRDFFPVRRCGIVPVVAAPEEIDITNADRLRSALRQAAAHGHGTLVVDMTRTRFCDCAGLHVLTAAHKQAQAEGRGLLLVTSGAAVLRLLAMTGIDRMIPSFTRLDQALAQTPGVQTSESGQNGAIAGTGARRSRSRDAGRLDAARLEFHAQARRFEQAKARLQATMDQTEKGRLQREILHASAFARLQARLESLTPIEQAKGILMAQQRCGPDEAFDLLRRASRRANVKVSVLAARLVEQAAAPGGQRRSGKRRPWSA
jgi:anti-sigma B factor antagonist